MEFKGTNGEWSIEESFDDVYKQKIFNISTDSMEGLAVIYTGGELFKDEQESNAKLIASAPDLLEALIKIRKSIKDQKLESNFGHTLYYVDEAIKKALL